MKETKPQILIYFSNCVLWTLIVLHKSKPSRIFVDVKIYLYRILPNFFLKTLKSPGFMYIYRRRGNVYPQKSMYKVPGVV